MVHHPKLTASSKPQVSSISASDRSEVVMEVLSKNFGEESDVKIRMNEYQRKSSRKPQHPQDPSYKQSHIRSRASQKRLSANEPQCTPRMLNSYKRPTDPEMVRPHIPSCSSLPKHWNNIHDRFIAYLATHAPLTESGKVPYKEELKERWKTEDIARLVKDRFPWLGHRIRASVIEKRLELLDEAGDNDFFRMRYGAYRSEDWGKGI